MVYQELRRGCNRMPKWTMEGATYFITWSMLDGLTMLSPHDRTLVANALKFFNGTRYKLTGYTVMDDHVHVIVEPFEGVELSANLHSWKSFTANAINKSRGTTGHFWKKDSYTRIIRSQADLEEKAQYMTNNPLKKWGVTDYEWTEWFW